MLARPEDSMTRRKRPAAAFHHMMMIRVSLPARVGRSARRRAKEHFGSAWASPALSESAPTRRFRPGSVRVMQRAALPRGWPGVRPSAVGCALFVLRINGAHVYRI